MIEVTTLVCWIVCYPPTGFIMDSVPRGIPINKTSNLEVAPPWGLISISNSIRRRAIWNLSAPRVDSNCPSAAKCLWAV